MCMIKRQNHVMIFYKFTIINTMSYLMIKEKKRVQIGPSIDGYDYNIWLENEEEESEDLPPRPPLEDGEYLLQGRKMIKIFNCKQITN